MLSDLDDDEADFGRSPEGANDEIPFRKEEAPAPEKKHRTGWIRFALIAVLTLILVTAGLAFFNRSSGTDYLFEQAREAAEHGDISRAVGLLEDVEAKESSDVDVLLYLALLYKDQGETVKYENLLLQVAGLRHTKHFLPSISRVKITSRWRTFSRPAITSRSGKSISNTA